MMKPEIAQPPITTNFHIKMEENTLNICNQQKAQQAGAELGIQKILLASLPPTTT